MSFRFGVNFLGIGVRTYLSLLLVCRVVSHFLERFCIKCGRPVGKARGYGIENS